MNCLVLSKELGEGIPIVVPIQSAIIVSMILSPNPY